MVKVRRRVTRLAAQLALLSLAAGSAASAQSLSGAMRLTMTGGYDSNPTQDFLQVGTAPDAVVSAIAQLQGQAETRGARASAEYEAAGRKFLTLLGEDTLAQTARVHGAWAVARVIEVGIDARGKDRRGGERQYTDLAAQAFVAFRPDARLDVRVHVGAQRFVYWSAFEYSYAAPEAGATVLYRFNRHHALTAFGELSPRLYNAVANRPGGSSTDPRRDTALLVGAGYSLRGPVSLTVSYSYLEDDSNSFGETVQRHRLSVALGFRAPWELVVTLTAAAQLSSYPDGVFLSAQYQLAEDNENANGLALRVAKPLGEHWDLQVDGGLYYAQFPGNQLTYLRGLLTIGATFRL